jgi:hypothetical protein
MIAYRCRSRTDANLGKLVLTTELMLTMVLVLVPKGVS